MISLDLFRLLTISGAVGNNLDYYGNNVLMLYLLVAQPIQKEIITFLNKAGSSFFEVNKKGWTVLHFAVANP